MTQEIDIREETVQFIAKRPCNELTCAAEYAAVGEWIQLANGEAKRRLAYFAPIKSAAAAMHKTICAKEKAAIDPINEAIADSKRLMLAWSQAEEAKRLAEQRKLQAEADAAATRERERLEKAAAKLKTPELREARLEEAAAVVAPIVTIPVAAPVIKGQSIRRTWRARVVDVSLVPREYMVVNDQALQAFARATKGAIKLAGVEMYEEKTMASGSR